MTRLGSFVTVRPRLDAREPPFG